MRKTLGSLTQNVAIYGAGDVAVSALNLLLLPVYIRHLTREEYGALALLIGVEAVSKIGFRWGLDGAFMRYYLDRPAAQDLQRLASTLAWFLLLASGILVLLLLLASEAIAQHLFGDLRYLTPLRIVLVNTFLLTFTFFPFHAMRMRGQAVTFSAFTFARSAGTLVLRLALVVGADWGLMGLVVADLVVTLVLLPVLWPWCGSLFTFAFSSEELRRCLRFGLPRLPHGLAQQALDSGNKYLLSLFLPLSALGVYQIGMTIGQSLKFFLSAFETGWAPFYYATARQPDARIVFGKITTYGIAILILLVAGLTAIASDLVALVGNPSYAAAAVVIPLIAVGVAWQGVYLLTSIGLNLTARTKYYPVATFAAAAVGLGTGAILMPLFGAVGAATSFLLSYVTLAGVAGYFARRYYPIPYEGSRIARLVAAGILAVVAGLALPALPPWAGVLARGTTVVAVFGVLLLTTGFLRPTERAFLEGLRARVGPSQQPTGLR
ncbi:MAG TPA: lipopolysaccharide biosynthesis protein [Vicinamibacterales bacterium]